MKSIMIMAAICTLLLPLAAVSGEYWQQETHYRIDADFRPDSNQIVGTTSLRYWNNSPDTLRELYFHLYNNAYRPGSYLDRIWQSYGFYSIAEADTSEWGGMDVESIAVAGEPLPLDSMQVDNSIMRFSLPAPLAPGDSLDLELAFRCHIPGAQWRNGARGDHYDIAQWFPRICVYDRHGWNARQHLSLGEFYADFGTYDVTLRAPSKFIIAHTGTLVNEAELFPDLPQGSPDTILTDILAAQDDDDAEDEADTPATTRTWIMHADRVIDFAMSADPNFIWDRTRTEAGAIIDCFYTPRGKENWERNGAKFTRFAIELFSEKFGAYPYPHYSVIASPFRGGVEYPMLTFVSSRAQLSPGHGLFEVIAHEVAHCWFYGILASNEIDAPFMDEGFAQFATMIAVEEYFGRWNNARTLEHHMDSLFSDADDVRSETQRTYIRFRSRMDDELPLTTSAEQWPGRITYGVMVYQKTATVLYALMDVLGEAKHYYDAWSFKHPYPEDLFESFDRCSGLNLSWFWEQWFRENWTVDFGLSGVERLPGDSAAVTVERHGQGIAPLTVRFELADGSAVDRRLGIGPWLAQERVHTFRLALDASTAGIERVVLDPDLYVPDLDRTNNYSGMMPLEARFIPPAIIYPNRRSAPPLDRQRVNHKPDLWYNEYDGVELGYYAWTNWLDLGHRWDAYVMVGTESGKIDWWARHTEIWEGLSRRAEWSLRQQRRDGRWEAELSGTYSLARYYWRQHDIKVAYRIGDADNYVNEYLHAQMPWDRGVWSEFEFRYRRPIESRYHTHNLTATVRTSGVGSEFDYQQGEFELTSDWELPNVPDFESRLYVSLMGGSPPVQRRPALSSGSPLEYFGDAYFRSAGTLPARGINEGHIFKPGGGHLLGYLSDTFTAPDNMATASVFRETDLLRHVVPQGVLLVSRNLKAIRLGMFADGGAIWNNNQSLKDAKWLMDAGPVLSYHVPYQWFERLFGDKPIRAYFPLWVSDPISGDRLDFRWQLAFTGGW